MSVDGGELKRRGLATWRERRNVNAMFVIRASAPPPPRAAAAAAAR